MKYTWSISLLLGGVLGEPLRRLDRLGHRQVGDSHSSVYANTSTTSIMTTYRFNATMTTTTTTTTTTTPVLSGSDSTSLTSTTWISVVDPFTSSYAFTSLPEITSSTTTTPGVNPSLQDTTCNPDSTVTYPDIPYTTITLTFTTDYLITGLDSYPHADATATTIFETPVLPCYTAIVSSQKSATTVAGATGPLSSIQPTRPGSSLVLGYAATVIITKKTPVKVYPTTVTTPPLLTTVTTTGPLGLNKPAGDGGNNDGNNGGNSGVDNGGNEGPNENNAGSNPGQSPGDSNGNGGNSGNSGNSGSQADSGSPGQNVPQQDTQHTIVVIAGESVTIQSPTVVIGGSTALIPSTGSPNPTQIVVNDKTFTILPGQIIGPSTTFVLSSGSATSTITQPPSTAVYNGVTATIGASSVVISGTTYPIGRSAREQTITINGQSVILNSHGVIFPSSTTFVPPITIGVLGNTLYEIVVANGITVSIQGTVAIISGTTFKIGDGATPTTTTFNGQSVILGPSGVVVGTATITPTSVNHTATETPSAGSGPSNPEPSATGNGSGNNDSKRNSASSDTGSKCSTMFALIITLGSGSFFLAY